MTEANRPTTSKKWPHTCTLKLVPAHIGAGKTNIRGTLQKRSLAGKEATVILGKKESTNGEIEITPDDHVWTVVFSGRGVMSSIGVSGEDVTILLD